MANPTPKTSSTRAQLPVGTSGTEPINAPEGALAYASDTELVRVKTSTGWEDVGAGGGGSITSIVGGDGIDVTDPSGPVVTISVDESEIDLAGDVNGPANANEVNAIHETSGPTQLTLGSIADGELLRRVGTGVVGVATSSLPAVTPAYLQHIWLKPPSVPNAWDDEFESGSADLATRGWGISTGTTNFTRIGDIQPGNLAAVTGTQYRSTIVGSCIVIQLGVGVSCGVWKSIPALASGDKYYVRFGASNPNWESSTGNYNGLSVSYSTSGFPDGNNRYLVSQSWDTGPASMNIAVGRAVGGSYATVVIQPRVHADIHGWVCVDASSSTPLYCNLAYSGTMQSITTLANGASGTIPTRSSLNTVYLEYGHINSASSRQPPLFWIDFFRKKTGNDWLIST